MALSDRLEALYARLGEYPGTRSVWRVLPDDAPDDGMLPGWSVNLLPYEFQASNVSIFQYPMQIVYMHERFPEDWEYGQLPAAVLDMPQNLFNWLAADPVIVHGGYGIDFGEPAGEIGVVPMWNETYAGCVTFLAFKEKENTVWA